MRDWSTMLLGLISTVLPTQQVVVFRAGHSGVDGYLSVRSGTMYHPTSERAGFVGMVGPTLARAWVRMHGREGRVRV